MKLKKVLGYLVMGGIFLVPFIPFVVTNSMFFPFITGKNFLFRIIVEVIFVAWGILAIYDTAYRPKRSFILLAIIAFISVMTLADIFGADPSRSFWSNYERMEGLVTLFHLLAYFVVATSFLNTEKLWLKFMRFSLGASIIMFIYVLAQLSGIAEIHQGGVRVDGTFGNATYLAAYALFHIFIATFLAFRDKRAPGRGWIYPALIIANIFVLYNTQTRGAILGLIAGSLLTAVLIAIFGRGYERARKISFGAVAAIIIFAGIFFALKDTSFVRGSQTLNRFASISTEEKTTKSRFQIWGLSLDGFAEHPVLGWGQDNFNLVFSKYYDSRLYEQEPFFDRAHNVFLDWLIAGGILGLLTYLFIFVSALWCVWRYREGDFSMIEKSVLTGLFAAYFFQNLFVFDNLISYVLFFSVLGYMHTYNVSGASSPYVVEKNEINKTKDIPEYISIPAVAVAVIALVFVVYVVNFRNISASRALIKAISPHNDTGLQANTDYFKEALSYDSFGNGEIRERLIQHATLVFGVDSAPDKLKQELFVFAREEMLKQIADAALDVRYEIVMGSFLKRFGMNEESLKHFERAVVLSPARQQIYFELVSAYINMARYDKALSTARTAYELERDNDMALELYAISSFYNGDIEMGKSLLIEHYGTLVIDSDNILNTYARIGENDLVIAIWEDRIDKYKLSGEDMAQAHVSLAAAYLAGGRRQDAIAELQNAIKIDPQFKEQGEYYIDEIRAGRNP